MSIRYKLLILLIVQAILILGIFLTFATNIFRQDKIAYIYDAGTSYSRSLALQIKTELKSQQNLLSLVMNRMQKNPLRFGNDTQSLVTQDDTLYSLYLFRKGPEGFVLSDQIGKKSLDNEDQSIFIKAISEFLPEVEKQGVSLKIFEETHDYFLYGQPVTIPGQKDFYAFVSVSRADGLMQILNKSDLYDSLIVRADGKTILQSAPRVDSVRLDLSSWDFFKNIKNSNIPEGAGEATSLDGKKVLAAYSRIGLNNLVALSVVDKTKALRAATMLIVKSFLFFIILIAGSTIASLVSSKKLTASLRSLAQATKQIAKGNFEVHVDVHSKDEAGVLAGSFNKMASEVSRLMVENIQKARMEKELETAKLIQDTLFPTEYFDLERVKISGFYEPATECSGDWWYYFMKDNKIFVCIADATGHGVPAALTTSAARSAISLLEIGESITPSKLLEGLNRAVYFSAKGQIQMTAFVGCFDLVKGTFCYSNASHESPFLLRPVGQPLRKKDLVPLNEHTSPRLGESLESQYEESEVEIKKGDVLFFYTDGVLDVRDPKGMPWDERNLIDSLTRAVSNNKTVHDMTANMTDDIKRFRNLSLLNDDVTFFICGYDAEPVVKTASAN